jgi:hypothetical protein
MVFSNVATHEHVWLHTPHHAQYDINLDHQQQSLQFRIGLQAAQLKHWAAARFAFEAALAVSSSNAIALEVSCRYRANSSDPRRRANALHLLVHGSALLLQGLLGVVLRLGDWQAAEIVAGALTVQDPHHPHAAAVLHSLQQPDSRWPMQSLFLIFTT